MNTFKKIVRLFLLTVLITPLLAYASGEDEIHNIIEGFDQAIKEKDKPAFMSLFVAKEKIGHPQFQEA